MTDADQQHQPDTGELERLRKEVRQLRESQKSVESGPNDRRDAPPAEEQPPPQRRSFLREHPIGAVVGLLLIIASVVGAFLWWQYSQTFEETDDAQIDGHLNNISTRVAGTVTAVYVVENQLVKQGDLLVELDPRDYQVSLERARANLLQAQAQVRAEAPSIPITSTTTETSIATARSAVANAQAGVAGAERDYEAQLARIAQVEANSAKAQADLQRYTTLVNKDEVSREEYDARVAAAKATSAELDSARAAAAALQRTIEQRQASLAQARSQLNQATVNAPRQISAQRASLELRRASAQGSRSALEEAQLNLSYTKIFAPVGGIIGKKAVDVGQRVQPGQQLVAIVGLEDIWVTANFKETQLRRMKTGQLATIHVDAFARDYDGYVESMPPATSARFSVLPPENASGNYVKVVQRLPVRLRFKQGQDPERRLRPGLSVVPKVWVK